MGAEGKKIYFVSDAHLGSRSLEDSRANEKKLVRWLEMVRRDAAAVYLLGDIFDYWFEYKYVVPKGYVRLLGKLAELADAGIEIHFFVGNHDMWMYDYLPQEIGAVIHREPLTVDLLERRFFLGHGDEVGRRKRSYLFLRSLFRNRFCQWLLASVHPRWSFAFALNWSRNSRKKGLKNEGMGGAEALTEFAVDYAKSHPDIDYFVFGHCHILLDEPVSADARLVITGDWISYFSYAEWDGMNLTLKQFSDSEKLL